jgi:tetratricopeptide (TPR) repeat protein
MYRGNRLEEARAYLEDTLVRLERDLGFEHVGTQNKLDHFQRLMRYERRPVREIIAFIDARLDRVRATFGPDAPLVGWLMQEKGSALISGQFWDEAIDHLREILEWSGRNPVDDPWSLMTTKVFLAILLRNQGRPEEAEPLVAEVLEQATNEDHLETAAMVRRNRYGPGRPDSPTDSPTAPLVIEAPFRAVAPIADGRVEPGEYGHSLEVDFTTTSNPGRTMKFAEGKWQEATREPSDLSCRLSSTHSEESLFLAFEVRDQFVDDQEWDQFTPHKNDGVEIYVNGDLIANDLIPGMPPALRGNREGFQIVSDAAGHQHTTTTGDLSNSDWSVGTSRVADGYIIEFEIPLDLIDTKDGPGHVPASTGSFLLMNIAVNDNDDSQSATQAHATLWNEGQRRPMSLFVGGEDFWNVGLRLTPGDTPSANAEDPDRGQ